MSVISVGPVLVSRLVKGVNWSNVDVSEAGEWKRSAMTCGMLVHNPFHSHLSEGRSLSLEGAFAGSSARYAALAAPDQRKSSAVVVALGLMLLRASRRFTRNSTRDD